MQTHVHIYLLSSRLTKCFDFRWTIVVDSVTRPTRHYVYTGILENKRGIYHKFLIGTWIFLRCLNNSLWWYILEPNQYSVSGDSYRPMGLNDHLSILYMNFLAKIFLINKTSWVKEIRYVYMVCLCSLSQICRTLKRCNNLDFSVHNQYYLFFS